MGARRRRPWWIDLPTERLLDVRLSDLELEIPGTPLEPRIDRLYAELERAGLRFRPSLWLSTGWFSPDGVPGFAIPFYLAHPRLARLELREMGSVEGGSEGWALKLLRHETGHALDTAYRLRRRKRWRDRFGSPGEAYRPSYAPDPDSRAFVHHLYYFYAQSHPAEDFAETFAVWLRPGGRWRRRYAGWPALRKLRYVDELMGEIADRAPLVRSRERTDALSSLRMTLRDHYRMRRANFGPEELSIYDRDLLRLFAKGPPGARRRSAVGFLRRVGPDLRRLVSEATGQHRFLVSEILRGMTRRAGQLGLRLERPEREAIAAAAAILSLHASRATRSARGREYWR
jgi:hypothetical protein